MKRTIILSALALMISAGMLAQSMNQTQDQIKLNDQTQIKDQTKSKIRLKSKIRHKSRIRPGYKLLHKPRIRLR